MSKYLDGNGRVVVYTKPNPRVSNGKNQHTQLEG